MTRISNFEYELITVSVCFRKEHILQSFIINDVT